MRYELRSGNFTACCDASLFASLFLASAPAAPRLSRPASRLPHRRCRRCRADPLLRGPEPRPLWFQSGSLSPAGRLILDRLRTANAEGFAEGPGLAARIDAALAAPAASPLAADKLLSAGWVGLVAALQGPVADARYFNIATKPSSELPDRTLYLASKAPDLSAHVNGTLRKSRFYEDLRAAMLTDAAAHGGAVDPRLAANLHRARVLPASGRYLFVNPPRPN